MNINEFTALIEAMFRNEKGRPYPIDTHMITAIFNIFNKQGVWIFDFFPESSLKDWKSAGDVLTLIIDWLDKQFCQSKNALLTFGETEKELPSLGIRTIFGK